MIRICQNRKLYKEVANQSRLVSLVRVSQMGCSTWKLMTGYCMLNTIKNCLIEISGVSLLNYKRDKHSLPAKVPLLTSIFGEKNPSATATVACKSQQNQIVPSTLWSAELIGTYKRAFFFNLLHCITYHFRK